MRQILYVCCITLLAASRSFAADATVPPEALPLWLTMRLHFQDGKPYKKPMTALANLLPESVVALPEWQQLASHSAHPPASRTQLARDLRALLKDEVISPAIPDDASMLTRLRAQLSKHLHITREDVYAESQLRETLRIHAARGELTVAARLIEEQSNDAKLRAWHARYLRRINDMQQFRIVAKAILHPPTPEAEQE